MAHNYQALPFLIFFSDAFRKERFDVVTVQQPTAVHEAILVLFRHDNLLFWKPGTRTEITGNFTAPGELNLVIAGQ